MERPLHLGEVVTCLLWCRLLSCAGASTSPVLHGLYALNRFVCLERKFRSLSVMVCELCQEHCEEQVSQLLQQMQTAMMEGEELERGTLWWRGGVVVLMGFWRKSGH